MSSSEPSALRSTVRLRTEMAAVFELGKPRLAFAAALTSVCGFLLAGERLPALAKLLAVGCGVLLVSYGSAAFNMVLERHADARMERTARRPLPSGRVSPPVAVGYASACLLVGLMALSWLGPGPTCLAAAMSFLYVCVYTPLKQRTTWNTLVGSVPGALPPLIGCAAAPEGLGLWALALFALTFCWQTPHFLPLAQIYRDDYRRGGMHMLAGARDGDARTRRRIAVWTIATLVASGLPVELGLVNPWVAAPIALLGAWFGHVAIQTVRGQGVRQWRRLFRASLLYLGTLLVLFLLSRV